MTLAAAAEWMFAALQVQVNGCALCRSEACSDTTHAIVRLIREALRRHEMNR